MGDLLQLFDPNQERMARKYFIQNSQVCGMEAPRNSLELPARVCQSCDGALGDKLKYTDQEAHLIWPEDCFPTDTSMKLINENTSKRTKSKGNAVSVVARLMGVDMLPVDASLVVQGVEKTKDTPLNKFLKQKLKKSGSFANEELFSPISSGQTMFGSCQHENKRDIAEWNYNMQSNKYKRREHPQEEELQKFKRDFEAWQTARFEECAKVVESGNTANKFIMQENLNNEKMVPYTNSVRMIRINESSRELEARVVKGRRFESGDLHNHRDRRDLFRAEKRDSLSLKNRGPNEALECSPMTFPDPKLENSSAPMKITILKPGLDTIKNYEESWDRSSGITEERDNMEDFLMEVKERLKRELQGKASKRGTAVRGRGIETPYSEKPSDPKQIAQHIAKQVRESVTRDLGVNLIRSESTKSYRSEFQYNEASSPEFISTDTRNSLSERLRNVLKGETRPHIPTADHNRSSSFMLCSERDRLQNLQDMLSSKNGISCWDSVINEQNKQTRSFRHDPEDDIMIHKDLSPKFLIRSLSAPVSGTSFGKLLLEDRHVLTGAHMRRKHEIIESVAAKVKEQKKEKFNFKKRVSSFKYSFILRGKLFSRKVQSPEKITNAPNVLNDIMSGATVMLNFCDRQNSTEVPPSPASICSSGYEELWRPAGYYSLPASDLQPLEENAHVFRDISSNLNGDAPHMSDYPPERYPYNFNQNELWRKLNQLDAADSGGIVIEEQPSEAVMEELGDQSEAYIRDLLVASGFYNCSADKSLSRWDPFAKPITNNIFEEVEESYMKRTKNNEGTMNQVDKKIDHKVLFDLLNESLSSILGPPLTMSKFRKKALSTTLRSPYGRALLSHVWDIMSVHVHPPVDKIYSLEGMVTRDLESTPWSVFINDDIDAVGKEIECWVVGDLIEEIINDIKPL